MVLCRPNAESWPIATDQTGRQGEIDLIKQVDLGEGTVQASAAFDLHADLEIRATFEGLRTDRDLLGQLEQSRPPREVHPRAGSESRPRW